MGSVALLLSPHLDDVVLSCPGYIQRLRAQGITPVIATVFTEADAPHAALYRVRRQEDRRAAKLLGASVTHLGFLDAPFRSPRYSGFRGIVFGRAREYPKTVRAVASRITALISKLRPAQVLAPLAVGNHVDHRVVRDAVLSAVDPHLLLFYEDRPYSFVPGQVGNVTVKRPVQLSPEYFEATYVRRYLGRVDPKSVAAKWTSVAPFPSKLRALRSVKMSAEEMHAALQAIRAYRTQVADLFAGDEELVRLYRSHGETLWSCGC